MKADGVLVNPEEAKFHQRLSRRRSNPLSQPRKDRADLGASALSCHRDAPPTRPQARRGRLGVARSGR